MFAFIESPAFARVRSVYLDDGKRGGLRLIYFVALEPNEFWTLATYAKARRDDVPGHIPKQLLEVFRNR